MRKVRRKRWFALVLLGMVLLLFYRSNWLGRVIYPIEYREEIEQASAAEKVDPLLVAAVIRVESNFRADRMSPKGAVGIMQVMPDTAQWMFERERFRSYKLEDLQDPLKNIRVGTAYLSLLHQQFLHNQVIAVASYNAGPGNVNKWLSNDTWDGRLETVEDIPFGETRKYVSKVMYYYKKYREVY
ncbi:MAG: lytic transglycosylase protein [Paenibacillaceae bacterium]|jgi:soluble lytic murein transglycosylase|nr:lytic transglycosylase protein [Paenibacillaceae bacterium]